MTEAEIQDALYIEFDRRRHHLIVPNVCMFGWESDLVSVTAAGFVCEYEIKCSRSDFKADMKKYRHRHLIDPHREQITLQKMPAYFYYVTPRDLISKSDLPAHAGLIYSHPMLQIVHPAPRLHANKITPHQEQWLFRSMAARYWRHRLKANRNA